MVNVVAKYVNIPNKHGTDYFIFMDLEVSGHIDKAGSYTNNIRVCAGVSACCYGIMRLVNTEQFKVECRSGYFHIWTERTHNLRQTLDRDSVYALNTLVCQLFEIYNKYPRSFQKFELNDIKELIDHNGKSNIKYPKHRKKRNKMDLSSIIESPHL